MAVHLPAPVPSQGAHQHHLPLQLYPQGTSSTRTGLGPIGSAVTGAVFFNDWSSPTGSVAMAREARSLDSCFGHSARGGSYHYHANLNCTEAGSATGASDPDICKLIGRITSLLS